MHVLVNLLYTFHVYNNNINGEMASNSAALTRALYVFFLNVKLANESENENHQTFRLTCESTDVASHC